jgi:hypothetical protein
MSDYRNVAFGRNWADSHIPVIPFTRPYVRVTILLMFCPQCQVEYLSGVTRCPDCGVALVDHPTEPTGDSDPKRSDSSWSFALTIASRIFPVFAICVLALIAVISTAKGRKDQVLDGVFVRILPDGEFYPGATDCSVSGTPWWVHSNSEFAGATPFDFESLSHRVLGIWRVRFVGDVSAIGRYGRYWRVVTVKSVLSVKKLESCKNIEEMGSYR